MGSNEIIEAALTYLEKHSFSIIPVQPENKKPYLKWAEFQNRKPTHDEVQDWFQRWPRAMIGIVTGMVSGIVVIDIDQLEAYEALSAYLPNFTGIPTVETPRGGRHLYFRVPGKRIRNKVGRPTGCDFRGEGGYIIAPPSINGRGKEYRWLLSLDEVPSLQELPEAYVNYLTEGNLLGGGENKRESGECHPESEEAPDDQRILTYGRRDDDLFHVATCLIKGGAREEFASQVVKRLAKSCEPPFDENEAEKKVKSAIKRAGERQRNLNEDLKRWIELTDGYFDVTDYYREASIVRPEDKHAVVVAIGRMAREGVIEKHGGKRGVYRRIARECEEIDFLHAPDEPLDLRYPLGIERYFNTYPKNIIVVAGSKDSGKTAFLLDFVRLNMSKFRIYFFSSEMGATEMRKRLEKFPLGLDAWKFYPKERSRDFADVIQPDDINIVDFLEIQEDFYRVGGMLSEIYRKLRRGIALVALQKNRGNELGVGGDRSLEKPRLYLTLENGRAKIIAAKNCATDQNPAGMELQFKLVQGHKFVVERDWHRPGKFGRPTGIGSSFDNRRIEMEGPVTNHEGWVSEEGGVAWRIPGFDNTVGN